ncbi:specifically androgen-regulated gene protein [Heteronotia binoei]|uniref:specifically androgen-regulated gene protein n=1 Tax=Heteronotia binoei TaxID=13085 RepID=UPI002931A6EA|nr:specifically androgen-regulated gene protein [Heteronotia binoei]XP_060087262.1 specifically androgen-regulated gene protein [Heteronotia binoei]
MPKKDLWVGTTDPDPAAVVGSADSCDSMISNDSSQSEMSDSGYDYLSVEEKECLMFLEETLDSLDAEADSGLSTDEAEIAVPSKHPRTWPQRDNPKELDHENLGKHQKNEQRSKKGVSGFVSVTCPGYHSLPRNVGVRKDPQTNKHSLTEMAGSNTNDPKTLPQLHMNSWRSHKLGTVDMPNDQPSISTYIKTPDLESVVIPPPEPFQDQWRSHFTTGQEPALLNKDSCKDLEKGTPCHSEVKRNIDIIEGYEARATQQQFSSQKVGLALGKHTVLKPLSPPPNKKITESAQDNYKKPMVEESPLDSSLKQGPPTAPKPRKLPPNIILKTSKNNGLSLTVESSSKLKVLSPSNGRPRAATGDFSTEKMHSLQKEQDRARREALEKLGLPQDKDPDDHGAKNSALPKSRETSRASSRENVNVDNIAVNKKPEQQHSQVGGKGFCPMEINIPGIKQASFKSNTLERSGVGLSSYVSSGSEDKNIKNSSSVGKTSFLDKISPSFLRNSRPRTASLGMGNDFTDLKENRMQNYEIEKSDKRRSYPLQIPAKLPRPPCVSVKITPKGATDEDRKEALKKLGLLKD